MKMIEKCPICNGKVRVSAVKCPDCGTEIKGMFSLSAISRLSYDDQQFIIAFILSGGKLKDLAKKTGVSYPTIRVRLDGVMKRLSLAVDQYKEDERNNILNELEKKNILPEVAAEWIREL